MKYRVILFYKFLTIKNPEKFMKEQKGLCAGLNLKGRMLVSEEGVNGTLEGSVAAINKYKKSLKGKAAFKNLVFKESGGTGQAFTRLEIKVRDEVVTLGSGKFDIKKETAKEITAAELEKLYKNKEKNKEDFVVLDLRNNFEIDVGYFENSVHPNLQNFRDLPEKIENLKLKIAKFNKVVAVCTGGIRCEKATCLLKREGFKNLYQLKDGIHTYMQKYPASHFKGSLFVFDNRMTTPVKELENKQREIVGHCIYCNKRSEQFWSNDSVRPSLKVIACNPCARKHTDVLRSCTPV
jgi:UPF0176 protein